MMTFLKEYPVVFPAIVFFISFVISFVGIKVGHKAKLDEHGRNIIELDKKITHLDINKQSSAVCIVFQKEIKDDIRTITGALQNIQESSVKTQTSIARIEGRFNGKKEG